MWFFPPVALAFRNTSDRIRMTGASMATRSSLTKVAVSPVCSDMLYPAPTT